MNKYVSMTINHNDAATALRHAFAAYGVRESSLPDNWIYCEAKSFPMLRADAARWADHRVRSYVCGHEPTKFYSKTTSRNAEALRRGMRLLALLPEDWSFDDLMSERQVDDDGNVYSVTIRPQTGEDLLR